MGFVEPAPDGGFRAGGRRIFFDSIVLDRSCRGGVAAAVPLPWEQAVPRLLVVAGVAVRAGVVAADQTIALLDRQTIALLLAHLIWWRRLFRKVIRHSSFLLEKQGKASICVLETDAKDIASSKDTAIADLLTQPSVSHVPLRRNSPTGQTPRRLIYLDH